SDFLATILKDKTLEVYPKSVDYGARQGKNDTSIFKNEKIMQLLAKVVRFSVNIRFFTLDRFFGAR
ncbi:MAG: hypothetical protein LBE38_05720, partial [Deltaproteobacteria bacterium]|nr:hypothetical protein [Deltaproteobacteria bacterium]